MQPDCQRQAHREKAGLQELMQQQRMGCKAPRLAAARPGQGSRQMGSQSQAVLGLPPAAHQRGTASRALRCPCRQLVQQPVQQPGQPRTALTPASRAQTPASTRSTSSLAPKPACPKASRQQGAAGRGQAAQSARSPAGAAASALLVITPLLARSPPEQPSGLLRKRHQRRMSGVTTLQLHQSSPPAVAQLLKASLEMTVQPPSSLLAGVQLEMRLDLICLRSMAWVAGLCGLPACR